MPDNRNDKLHEINRYEDPMFPVGLYTVTTHGIEPEGRGHLDLHWHEELQFTMMLSGSFIMQVNGQDYLLKEGQAIFINKDLLHITSDLSPDGKYFSINFPDNMLGYWPGSRMEHDYVHPYTGNLMFPVMVFEESCEWHRKVLADLLEVRNVMLGKNFGYQYRTAILLTGIWYEMFTRVGNIAKPSMLFVRRTELMQKMLGFIHVNYSDALRVADIAAAAEIDEGECYRCFRESIDESPERYLIKYRLSRAADLLDNTELSVEDTARKSGFSSMSIFADSFREKTGLTPAEFRDRDERETT